VKALVAITVALLVSCCASTTASAAPGEWFAPGKIVISPDGRDLYASGTRTLSFRRDVDTGELTPTDYLGPRGSSIAITPGGAWVFVGSSDYGPELGIIHVLARDPATGLLTHRYTFTDDPASRIAPGQVVDLAVSPDGRFLYVSQASEDALVVLSIDPANGALALVQALYDGPGGGDIALSPDGANLYATASPVDSFARDAASGRLTALPPAQGSDHGLQALHLAVAPDGKRVYAGTLDYSAFDRDPATGALTWRGNTLFDADCHYCVEASPMAISPDGATILSVHSRLDRVLQAAPSGDGAQLVHSYDDLPGANDGTGVAWSPDGAFAYIAGAERYDRNGNGAPYSSGGRIAVLHQEGDGLTSVSSVVPTPPALNSLTTGGLTVNDGAIYTNDPDVQLTVSVPEWLASSFRLANVPEFDGVAPTRVTDLKATYPWRLDTSAGPVRSVKHVWLRFTGDGVHKDIVVSDDIILDQTPPQVVSASLKRVGSRTRVTLKARDNRSGVRVVQVTRERSKPGRARKFAPHLLVPGAPRKLYVRVRDGAGNYSAWRGAKR
jgi:DNA-binding beta-propeller fold protein YncE